MSRNVKFVIAAGHPHEGKSGVIGGVAFKEGVAEVPAQHADAIGNILSYHSIAAEGTEEAARLEEFYAPIAAEKAQKAKAAAAQPKK